VSSVATNLRNDILKLTQWKLYVPNALTISNTSLCIYVFYMILNTTRLSAKHRGQVDLCNGKMLVFSLRYGLNS
jgi:hypothetical protein